MLTNFFKGMAIGIAFILPGVSAGTVILMLGFYRQLISDISIIRLRPYLPHLCGGAVAVLAGVRIIGYLLENYKDTLMAFLLGMLLASLRVILFHDGRMVRLRPVAVLIGIACFLLVWFAFSDPAPDGTSQLAVSLYHFFAGGIVAGATMILPGISGSTTLVIMNIYDDVIFALYNWEWLKLAIFSAGALLGIFLLARLLAALYRRYQDAVSLGLAGLVLGSIRSLLPSSFSIPAVLAALAGAGIVLALAIPRPRTPDQKTISG